MAMERVTVEQNGERFTLEVPEGTSDADIQGFLTKQQAGPVGGNLTTPPPPSMATAVEPYAAGVVREVGALASNLGQTTPAAWADAAGQPLKFGKDAVQALAERYAGSNINTPIKDIVTNFAKTQGPGIARGIGGSVLGAVTAPENLFSLPYGMAAYEQAKIRANPTAPGLETNPYAQSYRSQGGPAPLTQGQAGAMNQRRAVANMPFGNVNAQEQAILAQDQARKQQVQAQARAVLQQPPTAQNYIERMRALSTLYKPVNE